MRWWKIISLTQPCNFLCFKFSQTFNFTFKLNFKITRMWIYRNDFFPPQKSICNFFKQSIFNKFVLSNQSFQFRNTRDKVTSNSEIRRSIPFDLYTPASQHIHTTSHTFCTHCCCCCWTFCYLLLYFCMQNGKYTYIGK